MTDHQTVINLQCFQPYVIQIAKNIRIENSTIAPGLHKLFHPTIRDGSTWSKFGARGEHGERGKDGKHGDVLRFSTEVFSGSPT